MELSHPLETSYSSICDDELRSRAAAVVPGGMWGHLNAALLPEGYPQFFRRGEGCRLWDVDGREYIDFMCSWGPNILGHHDPHVEEAAARQRRNGDCLNGPGPVLVELAERLVARLPHADWALFQKNGTDATTTCVTIARATTKRRKILVARGAYHGAVPWCTPSMLGVTAEDRAHILHYTYNDPQSLLDAAAEAGSDLAAVIVSALKHDFAVEQALPQPEFARAVRQLCDRTGAALILDDVRAGFRIDLGGSWEPLGIRPDLSAFSKAIANGYALAAVTGSDRFRDAASKIYVTGSFWCAAVPMAAACATLDRLEEVDGPGHMAAMGQRLRDGIAAQAARRGVALRQTGPAQMPLILFEDDADFAKGNLFTGTALAHGAYMHPRHNMFLSVAHTLADIDAALEATDAALAAVAEAA